MVQRSGMTCPRCFNLDDGLKGESVRLLVEPAKFGPDPNDLAIPAEREGKSVSAPQLTELASWCTTSNQVSFTR